MYALDKQAHFLAGYAIAITLALVNPVAGVLAAVAVGGLKEAWDNYHPQTNTLARRTDPSHCSPIGQLAR